MKKYIVVSLDLLSGDVTGEVTGDGDLVLDARCAPQRILRKGHLIMDRLQFLSNNLSCEIVLYSKNSNNAQRLQQLIREACQTKGIAFPDISIEVVGDDIHLFMDENTICVTNPEPGQKKYTSYKVNANGDSLLDILGKITRELRTNLRNSRSSLGGSPSGSSGFFTVTDTNKSVNRDTVTTPTQVNAAVSAPAITTPPPAPADSSKNRPAPTITLLSGSVISKTNQAQQTSDTDPLLQVADDDKKGCCCVMQ